MRTRGGGVRFIAGGASTPRKAKFPATKRIDAVSRKEYNGFGLRIIKFLLHKTTGANRHISTEHASAKRRHSRRRDTLFPRTGAFGKPENQTGAAFRGAIPQEHAKQKITTAFPAEPRTWWNTHRPWCGMVLSLTARDGILWRANTGSGRKRQAKLLAYVANRLLPVSSGIEYTAYQTWEYGRLAGVCAVPVRQYLHILDCL